MDDVQKFIDEIVKNNKVVVFMKGNKLFPQCGFSGHVVDILKELNVDFKDVDVLSASGVRDGIKQYSSWPTIPQIFANGKFIGGCDIINEMHQKGELKKLLE